MNKSYIGFVAPIYLKCKTFFFRSHHRTKVSKADCYFLSLPGTILVFSFINREIVMNSTQVAKLRKSSLKNSFSFNLRRFRRLLNICVHVTFGAISETQTQSNIVFHVPCTFNTRPIALAYCKVSALKQTTGHEDVI